jgi:hypothetical protein
MIFFALTLQPKNLINKTNKHEDKKRSIFICYCFAFVGHLAAGQTGTYWQPRSRTTSYYSGYPRRWQIKRTKRFFLCFLKTERQKAESRKK